MGAEHTEQTEIKKSVQLTEKQVKTIEIAKKKLTHIFTALDSLSTLSCSRYDFSVEQVKKAEDQVLKKVTQVFEQLEIDLTPKVEKEPEEPEFDLDP
jgi:hypothetical protein